MITIRPCSAGDVAALEAAIPSGAKNAFHAKRFEQQREGESVYLVAYLNGATAGHVNVLFASDLAVVRSAFEGTVHYEVSALATAVPLRRRGVGRALLARAEDLARRRGAARVGLACNVDNEPARSLYDSAGYVDWGGGVVDSVWKWVDPAGNVHTQHDPSHYLVKSFL